MPKRKVAVDLVCAGQLYFDLPESKAERDKREADEKAAEFWKVVSAYKKSAGLTK